MKKLKKLIHFLNEKFHTPAWLFWLLLITFILRIPSFFEPYSYGDEMIYLVLGEAIRRGMTLYSQVHDNKPPLLYVAAAIAGNLFWFKALLALWHLVTVYLFWKLTDVLFPKKIRAQQIATAVFAIFTTIPLLEGNIANAELFMVGPTIAAFLILLTKKLKANNLLLSGSLFSMATLFKVPAMFDIPTIFFLWLATNNLNKDKLKKIVRSTSYVLLGFALPIIATFIYYWLQGAFREYLIAAFLQNVGYLSSWRPGDVKEPFLSKNAPLLIRGLIVSVGLSMLFLKRKRLSKEFLFATSWLLFSLFAVTLSERPYPHYLIQSIAPASILAAILFTYKNYEQVFAIVPLFLLVLVPNYFNFWHYPTLPYYQRFTKLITKKMSQEEYLLTFGGHIPRNYRISEFIVSTTSSQDNVFIWGDSSHIYALTKRFPPIKYVADYHIKDFSSLEETISQLDKDRPTLIAILPDSNPPEELVMFLYKNYNLTHSIDGADIYRLLSPRVRSLLSK